MRLEVAPGLFLEDPDEQVLAEIKSQREANPLTGYFPHSQQLPFHEAIGAKTPIVAFFGGNRSGKTHCSVADDLIQALPKEWVPDHLLSFKRWEPPFHCWIGVPKYAKLEEAIIPKLRALCPPSQWYGGGFDKAYSKQDKIAKFACGSTIGFKTYDQDVDAYSSAALHRMHWDEEPEGEHGYKLRQEARARLIDYGGDEIFSMTPLLGLSFVYEDVYEPWDKGEAHDKIAVIRADMDDNPHLNQAFKEDFIATLTDEERDARKAGKFVHFKGLVYPEFAEAHVVDPPSVQHVKNLEVFVGIDPGYRTTAVVFMGFDKDNSALIFDELYLHKDEALPEPTIEQIRLTARKWGIDPDWYYIDPVARNASLQSGRDNIEAAYQRLGLPVIPANNKVEAGILEVKRRLQSSPPGLLVSKSCGNWQSERGRYRLDDKEDGRFAVVKNNDHLMDATRYVCMARLWYAPATALPAPRHHTYTQDFQPPYSQERIPREQPPLGAFS